MQRSEDAVCGVAVDLPVGSAWQCELSGQGSVCSVLLQTCLTPFSFGTGLCRTLSSSPTAGCTSSCRASSPCQGSQTVTEAILHYAMSNCGWVQEEESRPTLLPGGGVHGR
mgnify:CR=1 FL=1